jgi:two-component system, NtrC family, nitrogen regulation sensor histidine kinase NtrY
MEYERKARNNRIRSAVGRAWIFCGWLALPAIVLAVILMVREKLDVSESLLIGGCLLLYLALIAAALIDGFVRPLQTLTNVIASLREGDYSFRARGANARDPLGELAGEVNALADLLQKQRVRSLEATALLARILEVMHAPLFAFDRDHVLQLINTSGVELLGRPYARCFGRTAAELGLEALLHAPDQTIHMLGGKPARWLLRKANFRQDGVPHTLLLLADVSVPLQEEEQAAWKRLIRVLGHELSNSLAPIKSIAGSLLIRMDAVQADEATARDFRRGLGVMESRADALHRFVQSYRQLAQLPPPKLRLVELAPLVERVALLEQRLAVRVDGGPAIVLHADPDQLEQMFINLLANAADATLDNGGGSVRVTWRAAEDAAWVEIEDSGQGIANADNLFVPFYTTKPAGSGVGLALAQQIARAHRGDVALVNREDGMGARATVRLPLEPAVQATAPAALELP